MAFLEIPNFSRYSNKGHSISRSIENVFGAILKAGLEWKFRLKSVSIRWRESQKVVRKFKITVIEVNGGNKLTFFLGHRMLNVIEKQEKNISIAFFFQCKLPVLLQFMRICCKVIYFHRYIVCYIRA